MKASIAFVLCCVAGCGFAYNVRRDGQYNGLRDDPFAVEVYQHFYPEPSQRFFWGNQGSSQVGGSGWWTTLTNKFPFLGSMFGKMEVPHVTYGVPASVYGPPQPPVFQDQFYQQLPPVQFHPQFVPGAVDLPPSRDVGFTDDAVIITPPQVPISQPASAPAPAPAPFPNPVPFPNPRPDPNPDSGYRYNKPLYRFDLPKK